MTPTTSPRLPPRRWAGLLLAALTVLLALLLPASTASAEPASAPGTRVGVSSPAVAVPVGVHESITAGQHWVRGPSQLRLVVGHCVAAEDGAVLNFGSKAAARQGLEGDAGTAANRFFRDATAKSQDFQAQELSGGGHRLQFFSPANNPGYGKLYVQEIDSSGNVIREFKNTMGPDGLIETKWVHGGP